MKQPVKMFVLYEIAVGLTIKKKKNKGPKANGKIAVIFLTKGSQNEMKAFKSFIQKNVFMKI